MARATFVKKARKDIPAAGVKAGESYYWWKFRFGSKHYSKTPPRPSQLTQSEYLSTGYSLQEQIEAMEIDPDDLSAAADELRSVADEIHQLGEEQESKIDNMPEGLQESDTAQLLRSRAEACESLADEIEGAADDIAALEPEEKPEPAEGEPAEGEEDDESDDCLGGTEAGDEIICRAQDIIAGIGWNWED